MIGRILITFLQCLLITFLAFVGREAWLGYEQEKLNMRYEKEGQPIQVHIANVTHEKKTWKDYIGNSKYLGFSYKGKAYNLRFVQDSGWVGEGSKVWLLYHPELDNFLQPEILYHRADDKPVSRLVNWTIVSLFSSANRWLFGAVAIVVLVTVLLCSVLSNITGLKLFKVLADWLIILCFLCGGIFFTWDSWANYRYYNQLKTGGSASDVIILDKHKITFHRNNKSSIPTYYYTAEVRYEKREREIMISSDDYDRLAPGDRLTVLYNARMDDMMAKDYSLGYGKIIFILLLWLIIIFVLKKKTA